MSRESHLELKVGSFVLIAALGLTFFVTSVSNFSFAQKGYKLQLIFTFANGLRDAAPVRVSGVEAGLVKHMDVYVDQQDGKKTKVRVNVWIREGVQIPADSTATINQLGLLGEKYIEITPGRSVEFLQENSSFIGSDPVPIEKITEQVNHLTNKLELTIDKINSGVLSDQNQKSLQATLADLSDVINHIKQGQGTVGKLLMDDSIYKNLDELTADLKVNPWKLLYRPKK
jgi:phospholipid/cholesterol/gamma-HCH transport system substrate-binding protein